MIRGRKVPIISLMHMELSTGDRIPACELFETNAQMYNTVDHVLVNNFWGDQIEVLLYRKGWYAAATYCNTPEGREATLNAPQLRPYYRMLHAGYEADWPAEATVLINSIHSEWLDGAILSTGWKLKLLGELTLNRILDDTRSSFFTQMNVNPERTRRRVLFNRLLLVRIKQMNMNIIT
ncbi:hypothetical protein SPFM9_00089 [Salmonella phage SPFM9]|nr:hypothetical protein SPFM9_00089 [Salmonella phage SPFM9]